MLVNGYGNVDGQIELDLNDLLIVWNISQLINIDFKFVDGFEVVVQYLFGESGFGFGVNVMFVEGDVEFDVDSLI